MLKLDYVVRTLAPITFTEKSGDNVLYDTKRYIPGSAVRGSLANIFIQENNHGKDAHLNNDFFDMFLSGKLRFLPCYHSEGDIKSIPAPCCLQINKSGDTVKDYTAGNDYEAGFKKLSGFIALDRVQKTYAKLDPNVQIEFHMSRAGNNERILGSSKEGSVFNYEYMESYQTFAGSIIAEDCDKDVLEKVAEILKNRSLRLGRSKTIQYGSAKVVRTKIVRIENETCGEKLYLYALTPFIPCHEANRIDESIKEIVEAIQNAIGSKLEVGIKFVNTEIIDGYVSVWNAKRERKTAISAGSVIELVGANIDASFLAKLTDLIYKGFGERTEDGFGQFRVWTTMPVLKKTEQKSASVNRPSLHADVKKRAQDIIRERIMVEIRKQAKEDAVDSNAAERGKGTLKRVELLMESNVKKATIMAEIAKFKSAAKNNLRDIRINGVSLWDMLLEENGVQAPYAGVNWAIDRMNISKRSKENMEKDLGADTFIIDADTLYSEYWLWFMRHTAKKIKDRAAREKYDKSIGARNK